MTKLARAFLLALLMSGAALAETSPSAPASLPPTSKPNIFAAYPRLPPGSLFKLYLVPFPWSCGGAFVMHRNLMVCYNYPFLHYYAGAP